MVSVGQVSSDVKRQYDSGRRKAQAELVRRAVIDAAKDLLLTDGYARSTVPRVAQACGVSPESVYKRFPGKPALVRAVVEQALAGGGEVAAEARSDALPAGDLAALLRGWSELAAEVAPLVSPILLLVQKAAGQDDGLADLARELDDDRRSRMTANAGRLAAAGHLRRGMSVQRAADVLWTYSSPELFDLLVIRSGWKVEQYAAFVVDGLTAHFNPGDGDALVQR